MGDGEKKAGIRFDPDLLDILTNFEEIELENVEIELGDLEFWFQPGAVAAAPRVLASTKVKPTTILEAPFTPPINTYLGQIAEVKLGATKREGGTRRKAIGPSGTSMPTSRLTLLQALSMTATSVAPIEKVTYSGQPTI